MTEPLDDEAVHALHTGAFGGTLVILLITVIGAYLGYPAVWVTSASTILLWFAMATGGSERARRPPRGDDDD